VVKPAVKRDAVRHVQKVHAVSLRRACGLIGMKTSSFYYQPKPCNDGLLRSALKAAAAKRRRWGYRLLTDSLRREGFRDNHKRIYRVYREEKRPFAVSCGKWLGSGLM
jgi:putative transposase